jgi:PLAT/LH2 domain-containing protein
MTRSTKTRTHGVGANIVFVAALIAALCVALPARPAGALASCPPQDFPCTVPVPEPDPNLPGTATLRLDGRTATSVALRWTVPTNATGSQLQRLSGTSWVSIYTRAGTGTVTRTDTSRARDTRYCYRVRTYNSAGSRYSTSVCVYTKDGRGIAAYRVQMRITTGNVSDAGTDDDVSVSVTGPTSATGGRTWVDHGRDDFERADTHDYDLVLAGVDELGDIESVAIEQQGDDDWCLQRFSLLVDGVVAYSQNYATCVWIGADSSRTSVSVPHAGLRAAASWTTFQAPVPPFEVGPSTITARMVIPRVELEQRIEGFVGHSIHGTDAYWGELHGRAVEATRRIDRIVDVDLDLAGDVPVLADPEVDVDFQLAVTAQVVNGRANVDVTMQNLRVQVDFSWWQDLLDTLVPCGPVASAVTGDGVPFCLRALADLVEDRVGAQVPRVQQQLDLAGPVTSVTAVFDSWANLVITVVVPR